MDHTPCGVESAGATSAASATGRASGLLRYRAKKSLKLCQFSGLSYQPLSRPKRPSSRKSSTYSPFQLSCVLRYAPQLCAYSLHQLAMGSWYCSVG